MKLQYSLLLGLALCGCGHQALDHFTVTGDIKGLKDSIVYLQRQMGDSSYRDSVVAKAGKFQFTGMAAQPVQAYLATKERYIPFFLENSEIRLEGKADSLDKVRITGSATQATQDSLTASIRPVTDQIDTLVDAYRAAKKANDSTKLAALDERLDSLRAIRNQAMEAFIRTHPSSPVSLYQIEFLTYSGSYHVLGPLFEGLDTALRVTFMGQYLTKNLAAMQRREVGAKIMDFTQNDLKGQPIRFTDYRKGRYVLLDFWASWCGPCRAENPNVLKAYNRFKEKNFVVLGVSLDEDSAKWRQAVVKDGMPWTQVSDLKGWKNEVSLQYGIGAIPANFLIDTSGTIIAQNLRGTALEKKLAEILQ
ncbi:MAG TPA: TlpA disulfide reductase family protein [Puia sp.]|jgi:peroxiredoxin|nr:TlpA disulfide reductase family protein [Puia sp.]